MDAFGKKTDEVNITITAPSDNEMEGFSSASDEENSSEIGDERVKPLSTSEENGNDSSVSEGFKTAQNDSDGVEHELCERLDSGVSLNDEKSSDEADEADNKAVQNYEIVGDRVLVEKDGKFELVDANEIKAEYFEMLGIKPEGSVEGSESSKNSEVQEKSYSPELIVRQRPKTTSALGSRGKERRSAGQPPRKRVQSSWGCRNTDYSNIKSPYGLSEKQLEIKRKREEAIARRKKEEADRQREEENRKREDAEQAFQAWLNSKREEAKERKRMASKENQEEDKSRAAESEKAFKAWKVAKKKQENIEREAAMRRMQETASMYVVHDRGTCEDAFKRWLRKKNNEKKAKEYEKKKRLKQKLRRKRKEPLPVNSDKIRFTDNYGYRNTVVY